MSTVFWYWYIICDPCSCGPGVTAYRCCRALDVMHADPSQQLKTYQLFRCGLVYDHMARVACQWDAGDLEAAGQDAALPISMIRSKEEFQASDHWQYHASTPLIQIEKIGESAPEPLPPSSRPLSGVRALGMTHVVAAGRLPRRPPD